MVYTAHYFTDNRNLRENRKEHSFRFSGGLFSFITDNGVFAKSGLDTGTEILLKTAVQLPLQGNILDLGCGWGSISVIIKKQFPLCMVTGADINPRAVELAALNAERNEADCEFLVSDGFSELSDRSYDWVISNPPIRIGKEKLYNLFAQSYEHLRNGGCLLIVIRRKQGAESAVKELNSLFGNCEILERDAGYWVLSSKKLTD